MRQYRAIIFAFLLVLIVPGVARTETKLIVTSGGLGFLPESSLASMAVAIIQESDTIHLGVVMSKDDEVIVLSDPILNEITDVAEHFPDKISRDGNYYVFDFTSAELGQLSLISTAPRQKIITGSSKYPLPRLQVASLQEFLGLVRMMENNLGRQIGIVVELRKNWLHKEYGKDLSNSTLEVLKRYGYTTSQSGAYLGSYDPEELQRIHDELLPAADMRLKLIQLITDNDSSEHYSRERGRLLPYNYDWLFTRFGLKGVSAYADVIGLPPSALTDATGAEVRSTYLADAHLLGLQVIAYPLDLAADSLPGFASDSDSLIEHYLFVIGLDGLLTSEGPRVRSYLVKRSEQSKISTQQESIDRLIKNAENNARNGNLLLKQNNSL